MRTGTNGRNARGFTLVELLITLVMLSVMLTVAAPSIQEFLVSSRSTVQTNDLLSDLSMARSEAVKLARPVEVRPNPTWSDGWVVGSDYDDDGTLAGTEIFRQHGAVGTNFSIAAVDGSANPLTSITFDATGAMSDPAVFADIAICRPDGNATKSRSIRIVPIGRAEVRRKLSTDGASC